MEKRIYDKKKRVSTTNCKVIIICRVWSRPNSQRLTRYGQAAFEVHQTAPQNPAMPNLMTSCKLTAYLADIDEQAEDMFFRLVKQLSEKGRRNRTAQSGKPNDVVARMNNIRNRAEEIVTEELI